MAPLKTIVLTLLGVLAAGLPLLRLTEESTQHFPREISSAEEMLPAGTYYTSIHYTGTLQELKIHHQGKLIATLPPDAESPWETEISLPNTPSLELEILARWSKPDCEQTQAVGVVLEPEGREAQEKTLWNTPHSPELHNICTFSW
ncbi:MAG: hypothetical protein IKK45_01990 [Akkermansia sp.]|nr:hypothetical protein [Akkermansia sp.]